MKWDGLVPWVEKHQAKLFLGVFALFVVCGLADPG